MVEKRERKLSNQLATFIPECVLVVLAIVFVALAAYNFIPGHNYMRNISSFGVTGALVNLVLLILSCSICVGAGVALIVVAIVGRYRDKIFWPHHISFITGFVFITCGAVILSIALLG